MVEIEICRGYFRVWDSGTAFDVYVDDNRDFSGLPDLDEVYNFCQEQGCSQEKTIEFMLKVFHRRRVFKGGYLQDISLVIGIVGGRGGGKSAGAVMITIFDYILAGVKVWSNMKIKFVVKYRDCRKVFETIDLDKASLLDLKSLDSEFASGAIYVDEINAELGDALRSTTNKALLWSHLLQMIRKKDLDVIWSTQNEDFATSRTRWQTDFYIVAKDLMFSHGTPTRDKRGKKSLWHVHDMSGMVTGEIKYTKYHRIDWYAEKVVWNRPFWNCYDHRQLQGQDNWEPAKKDSFYVNATQGQIDAIRAKYSMVAEILENVIASGLNEVETDELWQILNVDKDDKPLTTKLGLILSSLGVEKVKSSPHNFYRFPDVSVMREKLENIGTKGVKIVE